MQRNFIHWEITVILVETGCRMLEIEVATDGLDRLVEVSTSVWLLLEVDSSRLLFQKSHQKTFQQIS